MISHRDHEQRAAVFERQAREARAREIALEAELKETREQRLRAESALVNEQYWIKAHQIDAESEKKPPTPTAARRGGRKTS